MPFSFDKCRFAEFEAGDGHAKDLNRFVSSESLGDKSSLSKNSGVMTHNAGFTATKLSLAGG